MSQTYAVGPMQLYSDSYKDHADTISGLTNDELGGGRWMPRYNIIGGAFALRDKLKGSGAEATLGRGGSADKLIWEGVADYGHLFAGETERSPTGRYSREVRTRYEENFKEVVDQAVETARQNAKDDPEASYETPTGTYEELKNRVLDNKLITYAKTSAKNDVTFGLVDVRLLKFLLAFSNAGFSSYVWVFKTGHDKYSSSNLISAHWYGRAVDLGNYSTSNMDQSYYAMQWIKEHQVELGFKQLIGPVTELCVPLGLYDSDILAQHKNHIHVGYGAP